MSAIFLPWWFSVLQETLFLLNLMTWAAESSRSRGVDAAYLASGGCPVLPLQDSWPGCSVLLLKLFLDRARFGLTQCVKASGSDYMLHHDERIDVV